MKTKLFIHQSNSYRPKQIILDHEHSEQIRAQRDKRAAMRQHQRQWDYFKGNLTYLFSLFKEALAFVIVAAFLITVLTAFIFSLN